MTKSERVELIRRLFASQRAIKDLTEHLDSAADMFRHDGESGLAFSVLMIRESLSSYSSCLVRYARKHLGEEDDD